MVRKEGKPKAGQPPVAAPRWTVCASLNTTATSNATTPNSTPSHSPSAASSEDISSALSTISPVSDESTPGRRQATLTPFQLVSQIEAAADDSDFDLGD